MSDRYLKLQDRATKGRRSGNRALSWTRWSSAHGLAVAGHWPVFDRPDRARIARFAKAISRLSPLGGTGTRIALRRGNLWTRPRRARYFAGAGLVSCKRDWTTVGQSATAQASEPVQSSEQTTVHQCISLCERMSKTKRLHENHLLGLPAWVYSHSFYPRSFV